MRLLRENIFFFCFTDDIQPWMTWAYYMSPMMYGQTAIVMNEFLDERWSSVRFPPSPSLVDFSLPIVMQNLLCYLMQPNYDTRINAKTVGEVLLKSRGFFTEPYWFWICIVALLGFSLLFNLFYILALMYLNRKYSYFLIFRLLYARKIIIF